MNMCSEEYESFGWFVPEDLIKPDAQLKLHPVLFRGVKERRGEENKRRAARGWFSPTRRTRNRRARADALPLSRAESRRDRGT